MKKLPVLAILLGLLLSGCTIPIDQFSFSENKSIVSVDSKSVRPSIESISKDLSSSEIKSSDGSINESISSGISEDTSSNSTHSSSEKESSSSIESISSNSSAIESSVNSSVASSIDSSKPSSSNSSISSISSSNKPSSSSISSINSSSKPSSSNSSISSSIKPSSSNSSKPSSSSSVSSFNSSSYTTSSYVQPSVDSKWNVNFSEYGSTFRNTLAALIKAKGTKTTSYSSMLSVGAAAARTSGSNFVPFYHSSKTTTTTGSCNREHTWPNSRGGGSIETDPFMIRPTLTKDNSSRGNNFYGLGTKEWDPASCESGFYEARGEAARIMLYAATRYYSLGLSLSNNPSDATSAKTMGTLKYLIQWNNTYAPTAVEIQINNYLDQQGYGRNPFVDHPEYANYIWTENGLRTSPVDGGGSGSSTSTSSSSIPSSQIVIDYEYTLEDSLNDIDGSSYIINSCLNGTMYSLTAQAKSDTLPWYLVGTTAEQNSDCSKMNMTDPVYFTFEKQTDGTYTIYNEDTDKYLCSYQDYNASSSKYFYSIGMYSDTSSITGRDIQSSSKTWTIEKSGNGYHIYSKTTGVHLEYYGGSWCGYKNAPSEPIYLYN